jgi:hypothetical protein
MAPSAQTFWLVSTYFSKNIDEMKSYDVATQRHLHKLPSRKKLGLKPEQKVLYRAVRRE